MVGGGYYVVGIDGGICSQMWQYMIGYCLSQGGASVKYDLSWFKKNGKDMNGTFSRNFDLLKLFPDLPFAEATTEEIIFFKRYLYMAPTKENRKISNISSNYYKAPVYLGGYYDLDKEIFQMYPDVFKLDCSALALDERNKLLLSEIENTESVGVHVRRGDMAYEGYWWHVVKPQYYYDAIQLFDLDKSTFYFFSDEPDWVYKEISPFLGKRKMKYKIVDFNGSDKGYIDFILLSSCKHIIASQGSLGSTAFAFNMNKDKVLVVPSTSGNSIWQQRYVNDKVVVLQLKE